MATNKKTPPITKLGNNYRYDIDGWSYLHIEGNAHDRGYGHGYLMAKEIETILRSLKFLTYYNTGYTWEYCVADAVQRFVPRYDQADYQEYMDEIKGIAEGAQKKGVAVTWQEILTWNGYEELTDYCWPKYPPEGYTAGDRATGHCSAFLALVPQPQGDSKIVMAHNSWDNFVTGQFFNLIIDLVPQSGQRILMQSSPGFIDSFTDFFVTGAGIMGTETTIGGFNQYSLDGTIPEFFRVRRAMQYAKTLDRFVEIMVNRNSGGYANSWLLADIESKEIMRFELGLKYWNVERKSPQTGGGHFIGFNAPLDPRIRNLECSNTGYCDIRRHQGGRQVRLAQLMEQHGATLDVEQAKKMLADHYDVYLQQKDGVLKENPCSRTVCGHYYEDPREYMSQPGRPLPFQPRGTYDGKVMDSDMAAKMSFWARWGNSCGARFVAADFLKAHPQWNDLQGYLLDRGGQAWSQFTAGE